MKKLSLLILLLVFSFNSKATTWYASPTGNGVGTLASPFNLASALNNSPAVILPGDILYLRGGTYIGRYVSNLFGTAANYITVTSYPGEWAVLNGNILPSTSASNQVLFVAGGYVKFRDFEITYNNPVRNFTSPNFVYCEGIDHDSGEDCNFINLVIHDNPGTAFTSWKLTGGTLIYGCKVYNNGWIQNIDGRMQHGPGFYVQNISDTKTRVFKNNIVFNNFSVGFEVWSASFVTSDDYVKNVLLEDNTAFNNGSPFRSSSNSYGDNNILVKTNDTNGSNIVRDVSVINNALYHNTDYTSNGSLNEANSLEVGANVTGFPAENIVVRGNFISGRGSGLRLLNLNTVEFSDNMVLGRYVIVRQSNDSRIGAPNWNFFNNKYFTRFGEQDFRMVDPDGSLLYDITFDTWKSTYKIDMTGSSRGEFILGNNAAAYNPPRVLRLTQNEYNTNLYKAVLFNSSGSPNVDVNFSGYGIPIGTPYTIRDIESHTVVASSGTLSGSGIITCNLNMTMPPFLTPQGTDFVNSAARTPDNFGVFLIEFSPYYNANDIVYTTKLQADGKIIFGGDFTDFNAVSANRIARLNTNMTLDNTFVVGSGANNTVLASAIQTDGKIVIGGRFTDYNGNARNGVVRLNSNGTIDTTFSIGIGFGNAGGYFAVNALAIQSDGKILASGVFSTYNGITKYNIIRLNANGSVDTTFSSAFTVSSGNDVNCIAVQTDGKIIIGGWFTTYGGTASPRIARLNANGTIDTAFTSGTGFSITSGNCYLNSLKLQTDGKILAGGFFNLFNGVSRLNLARLNSNGTLDTTFVPDTILIVAGGSGVKTIDLQTDGKIFIGGGFKTIASGDPRPRIGRLNTNGTLDLAFDPEGGFGPPDGFRSTGSYINSLSIQADGKVVTGGKFSNYNGIGVTNITRLNPTIAGGLARNSIAEIDYGQGRIFETPQMQDPFENVLVYPNPCTDYFTLDAMGQKVDFIEVVNRNKETVKSQKIFDSNQKINIEALAKDIYFIKIYSNKSLVKTLKIFKQ